MIKDLVPVVVVLVGIVYMFNMSIEADDRLFSENIDAYLEQAENRDKLKEHENEQAKSEENEENEANEAKLKEFDALLENEKYLEKAIALMNDKEAAEKAAADAEMIKWAKIALSDDVEHDGNPETETYKIKLDGSASSDPDDDSIEFLWQQTAGKDVTLSSTDSETTSFETTAGKYSFSLTVTDAYGASDVYIRDIQLGPEPNQAPEAEYTAQRD